MTDTLRLPYPFSALGSCLLVTALTLFAPAVLAVKTPIDAGIYRDADPALGIADSFGRWNRTIRLVYDPDNAPAAYSQNDKVLALVREAFGYWTQVSGVRFEIIGVDAGARDDRNVDDPDDRDGLVRISWGAIGSSAGRAGPISGWFDQDLGYFPYEDGTVELNNGADVIGSDFDLVNVLVHELGHLLGLGHSDNPDSVMFANPYNHLRYPRSDDIRAMQVMYGAPATAIDAGSPLPGWLYSARPQASAAATQFLFRPGPAGSGAAFEVNEAEIASVTSATPNDEFVWFAGSYGGSTTAVNLDASFVVVDPSGYQYDEREWTGSCNASSICTSFISVAEAGIMKTRPGTWKVYVVDKATNLTLTTLSLPVNTTSTFNKAPTATLTSAPGSSAAQARFTLSASDPEGAGIDVIWYPPGPTGPQRSSFASGGSAALTVNFAQTGTHTFYAEVRDKTARYGDGPGASEAGEGFQTLLRITVTLPAATVQVVSTQDTGQPLTPNDSAGQQLLTSVAKTPSTLLVANSGGVDAVSNANVGFRYGASSDQGVTTKTSFKAGDNIVVAGSVSPQAADLGKAAEIFVVVRTTIGGVDIWTYRNSSGQFVPWAPISIAALRPAYSVSSLQTSQAFEIHNGGLVAAQHSVYLGYRLSGGTLLFYTGNALDLTVTN